MDQFQRRKGKGLDVDLNDEFIENVNISSGNDSDNDCGTEKRLDQLTVEDVLDMKFDSAEEGETFYDSYAKVMGFSIRKQDVDRDGETGMIIMRKWVCSREGYRRKFYLDRQDRKRESKPITRLGCAAKFRINYNRVTTKWEVRDFVVDHKHLLVSMHEVPFLRSHRFLTDADKAEVKAMRNVGVKTSQIHDYMVQQAGGYENVGFIRKDLYNHLNAERREDVKGGDAQCALVYLTGKSDSDPFFYYKYTTVDDNRLGNLFWADSRSRSDYVCFGDVLAFDTTYRTNTYCKPFVILVGVNHHFETTVFGCALLVDETTETYKWVLETFLDAMDDKKPISVITDGDKAMASALRVVLPEARHRLCSWHLQRNAESNVKDSRFHSEFQKFLLAHLTPEEFECAWKAMVVDLDFENHPWIERLYNQRFQWAEAYLNGQFFAGMRSTQRCEGMNAYLKRFVESRCKLYELVQQFDRALARIRHNEAESEYQTNHTEPVLRNPLSDIESYAANVYTRTLFFEFRKQMNLETLSIMEDRLNNEGDRIYNLCQYKRREKKFKVVYTPNNQTISCTCMMFESFGIPCSHSIFVMKAEHLEEIPPCLISKRWTKMAKIEVLDNISSHIPSDHVSMVRYGALSSACDEMCFYGSKSLEGFQELRNEITKVTYRMKKRHCSNSKIMKETPRHLVSDPYIVKTKGNHDGKGSKKDQGPRRCGHCRNPGHTKRKCPQLANEENEVAINEQVNHVNMDISDGENAYAPTNSMQGDTLFPLEDSCLFINLQAPQFEMDGHLMQYYAMQGDMNSQPMHFDRNSHIGNVTQDVIDSSQTGLQSDVGAQWLGMQDPFWSI